MTGVALALDVGEKRIGLAASDPSGTFSFPIGVVERTNIREDLDAIVTIARERAASTIVVGYPLTMSGERGLAAERMDAFIAKLARVYGGSIERVDERLTSAAVNKSLIGQDVSRAKRKKAVDTLAAAMILDTYLAQRRNA